MDSTPTHVPVHVPVPVPVPVHVPVSIPITTHHHHHHLISSHPVSKLPIKRKNQISPNSHSRRDAPYKFHRIWTEPDEILFLQSLINSPPLSFPRDLHIFFNRFLNSISRPYSKSQLSEKLRRLRNKWRLLSTRLSKGLDLNRLSPHDRMLFQLSGKLWHPHFASTSPFGASLASISICSKVNVDIVCDDKCDVVDCVEDENCCDDHVNLMSVENAEEDSSTNSGNQIGKIVAKTLVDVFDESLKFVKSGKSFWYGGAEDPNESFHRKWRELRVVEMEVLAQRLRLVVEDSIINP